GSGGQNFAPSRVGAVKAERIPPSKSARFSALHRLRHSRRHDLDRGDCAWLSSPRALDWSRVTVKGCIGEGGFATLIRWKVESGNRERRFKPCYMRRH